MEKRAESFSVVCFQMRWWWWWECGTLLTEALSSILFPSRCCCWVLDVCIIPRKNEARLAISRRKAIQQQQTNPPVNRITRVSYTRITMAFMQSTAQASSVVKHFSLTAHLKIAGWLFTFRRIRLELRNPGAEIAQHCISEPD